VLRVIIGLSSMQRLGEEGLGAEGLAWRPRPCQCWLLHEATISNFSFAKIAGFVRTVTMQHAQVENPFDYELNVEPEPLLSAER
jgi:hypothetical protein